MPLRIISIMLFTHIHIYEWQTLLGGTVKGEKINQERSGLSIQHKPPRALCLLTDCEALRKRCNEVLC